MTGPGKGGGGTDITNIEPFIRRRKKRSCPHLHVEVCDDAQSLSCVDCDVELDPWWFLRNWAHNEEAWDAHLAAQQRQMDAMFAKHNAWVEQANVTIADYNQQIQHLCDVKNRLQNEVIGGERLGSLARRRPRRRVP